MLGALALSPSPGLPYGAPFALNALDVDSMESVVSDPAEELAAWQAKIDAQVAELPMPCSVTAGRLARIRWSEPEDARATIRSRCNIAINDALSAEWSRPLTPAVGTILYVHGAAQIGSAKSYRPLTSRLCAAASAYVMTLEYRRPPEVNFPAPLSDVISAVRWLTAHKHPINSVVIAADSFGAVPALAATMRLRDGAGRMPRGLYLLCPDADSSNKTALQQRTCDKNPKTCSVDQAFNRYFDNPRYPCTGPEASPGLQNLAGLPPILMHESQMAPLAHALQLRDRLLAEPSVVFTFRDWPLVPHVWPNYGDAFTYTAEAMAHAGAWIKDRLT